MLPLVQECHTSKKPMLMYFAEEISFQGKFLTLCLITSLYFTNTERKVDVAKTCPSRKDRRKTVEVR